MKLTHLAAIGLLAFSAHAFAGEQPGKITYTQAQLSAASIDSIPELLQKYVAQTDRTSLIHPSQVVVLVDGRKQDVAPAQLPAYKTVEILGDGESIVLNFRS